MKVAFLGDGHKVGSRKLVGISDDQSVRRDELKGSIRGKVEFIFLTILTKVKVGKLTEHSCEAASMSD